MNLVPLTAYKFYNFLERNNKVNGRLVIHVAIAILQIIAVLLGFLLL